MASTADFRNGMCIEYNDDLYSIVQFQHVKPGKGPAFVRTKLKNVKTGKVIDNTFNSGVKINVARIERRPHQYTFKDETGYHFMHSETYEELILDEVLVENYDLMKDGQEVEVVVHADTETAIRCELPPFVELQIVYTEPGVRGDTSSTSSLKQAEVETGATINVPLFIENETVIKIDTRSREYVERVK